MKNSSIDNTTIHREEEEWIEEIVQIRRLSKKTIGGNYISFSALAVVGDGKGKVGIGLGRGLEVPQAIKKAISFAKKHTITIPLFGNTIPHEVRKKYKGANVLLKPAPEGVGLKVGSVARVILRAAGVVHGSGKILGSRNQIVNAQAVMLALKELRGRKPHSLSINKQDN